MESTPKTDALAIIAGRGAYPLLLAESARKQGVSRIVAVAFPGETDKTISRLVDEVTWIRVGELGKLLEALNVSGVHTAAMAGQIRPRNLFRVRMDAPMRQLLARLPQRNADTIFGAVADELAKIGISLLPASSFMESCMPPAGILTRREPTPTELVDIAWGMEVAKTTSGLEIGQTVVIKEGTIIAVEAFEGTDAAIKRAGHLAGQGCVVVKVAKQGHDMRFDIPVVGMHTLKVLRKARVSALAVEAGRAIFLEQDKIVRNADAMGLCITVIQTSQNEKPNGETHE